MIYFCISNSYLFPILFTRNKTGREQKKEKPKISPKIFQYLRLQAGSSKGFPNIFGFRKEIGIEKRKDRDAPGPHPPRPHQLCLKQNLLCGIVTLSPRPFKGADFRQ